MPSFSHRGLITTSPMCWALVVAGTISGPSPTPNASFSIARVDGISNDFLCDPFPACFEPTSITGFVGFDGEAISSPSGDANVYDPTTLEIFWSWDFGDDAYTPIVTPNVPTAHRDTNKAYVKRPWHVFTTPGNKTVRAYGYDSAGNWGTATYTFNDVDGDSPAIIDRDTFYTDNTTIYYSPAGIFPSPTPTRTATTLAQLNTHLHALTAFDAVCVKLRRGETYDLTSEDRNAEPRTEIDWDVYGDSGDPLPSHTGDGRLAMVEASFARADGLSRFMSQNFNGPYDAATETGRRFRAFMKESSADGQSAHLCHRVTVSGAQEMVPPVRNTGNCTRIFHDMEITNWQNYGMFASALSGHHFAFINVDFHQKSDALSGIDQGGGNSNGYAMGNRHGPWRQGFIRSMYIACSSFFSRNGWSLISGGNWTTRPPTTCQAAWRWGSGGGSVRTQASFERSSFEGGDTAVNAAADPDSTAAAKNILFESCTFIGGTSTEDQLIKGNGLGACVRNCYFWFPNAAVSTGSNRLDQMISWGWLGATTTDARGLFVFNNTAYIAATDAQLGGTISRVFAVLGSDHLPVEQNNIYYAPEFTTPQGESFEPLGSTALAGCVARNIGARWNFKPVGWASNNGSTITCEAGREIDDGIGKVTAVGPSEWMAFDYPDYSGQCNGAGDALMAQVALDGWAAVMAARTTPYDQVSFASNSTKARAPTAAGGPGGVLFNFTDTKIRIQNTLGATSYTGDLWIMPDLRDWLMEPIAATASPSAIPAPVPGTGSAAILETESGLFHQRDFFGSVRQGKTAGGQAAVTGKPFMQGAFVEIPA